MMSKNSDGSGLKFNFTIEDVRKQLNILGYNSVPDSKLAEFADDLRKLIEYDQRKSGVGGKEGVESDDATNTSANLSKTVTDCGDSTLDDSVTSSQANESGNVLREGRFSRGSDGYQSSSPEQLKKILEQQNRAKSRGNARKMKRVTASRRSHLNNSSGDESTLLNGVGAGGDTDENGESESNWKWSLYQRGLSAVSESRRPQNYYKPPSSARPDLYPQRPLHEEGKSFAPHLPRSFIRPIPSGAPSATNAKACVRPTSCDTHVAGHDGGRDKKSDPVTRFNAYNQAWKERKAPGEQNRNQLRWRIREQMAVFEEVSKKKNSKPGAGSNNQYVVPTEKKRQDLRWEVRCNLAAHKLGSKNTQYY